MTEDRATGVPLITGRVRTPWVRVVYSGGKSEQTFYRARAYWSDDGTRLMVHNGNQVYDCAKSPFPDGTLIEFPREKVQYFESGYIYLDCEVPQAQTETA